MEIRKLEYIHISTGLYDRYNLIMLKIPSLGLDINSEFGVQLWLDRAIVGNKAADSLMKFMQLV